MSRQKKQSVNLKIGQEKFSRLRKKKIEEKQTEPKGPLGYRQADQHKHYGSPQKERGRRRENIRRNNGEKSPNLMKDMNTNVQEV